MEGEHEDRQQERKKEEVWRVNTGTDRKGGRRKSCGGRARGQTAGEEEGRGVEGEHEDRQQERKKEEVWRVSTRTDSRRGRRKRCGG